MKKQKQSEISNSPDLTQIEGGKARIWTQSDFKSSQVPTTPTNQLQCY